MTNSEYQIAPRNHIHQKVIFFTEHLPFGKKRWAARLRRVTIKILFSQQF